MDRNVKQLVTTIREAQLKGACIATRRGVYGGQDMDALGIDDRYEYGRWVFKSPYGVVEKLGDAFYTTFFAIYPNDDWPEKIVKNMIHYELGVATINWNTSMCIIDAGEMRVEMELNDITEYESAMTNNLMSELSSQKARILICHIEYTGDQRAWKKRTEGKVSNDVVNATLTGFALSPNGSELIYVGAVAHQSSLKSLAATIRQGKLLTIDGYDSSNRYSSYIRPYGDGKYKLVMSAVPSLGETHGVLVARAAMGWIPDDLHTFVLQIDNGQPFDLNEAFFSKFDTAMQVAISKEWVPELIQYGKENRLVRNLKVWGDCVAGYEIDINRERWDKMLNHLLAEDIITVKEI